MTGGRTLLLALAAVPVAAWLAGGTSETADAVGSLLLPALALAVVAILPIGGRARPAHWVAATMLLAVGAAAIGPEIAARWRQGPARGGERLVIVTHNVSTANAAPEATAAALLASDADVLLLQETDGPFAAMLPRLRAHYRWSNECPRRCSLAILSRWPLDRVRYRLRDPSGAQIGPPLLQTILRPPGRAPVPLMTLHLGWPIPAGRQAAARRSLGSTIRVVPPARAILTGDFNLTAWSAGMRGLDAALAPLARVTRFRPSWPARLRGLAVAPAFLPIDHVFAGPGWRVERVETLGRTGSDHLPVRAVLVGADTAGYKPAASGRPDDR